MRRLRRARGLSQQELAARVGVSRQLIGALEADRHVPAVDTALRLAAVLGTTVEALFAPAGTPPGVLVAPVPVVDGAPSTGPAVVARVGARQVFAVIDPADGLNAWVGADAVADYGRLRMLHPVREDTFVVLGCDPALGLAAAMLRERGHAVVAVHASSSQAVEAMQAGRAHAACVHGPDGYGLLSRPESASAGWRMGSWYVGLAAPARPVELEEVAVGRLPLVRRDASASSQQALERALVRIGAEHVTVAGTLAGGHVDAARQAAAGQGAAVTMTAAAATYALVFTPIEKHHVVLWVARPWADHPAAIALGELLTDRSYTGRLAAVGGYEELDAYGTAL